jgi:hypothetical protein
MNENTDDIRGIIDSFHQTSDNFHQMTEGLQYRIANGSRTRSIICLPITKSQFLPKLHHHSHPKTRHMITKHSPITGSSNNSLDGTFIFGNHLAFRKFTQINIAQHSISHGWRYLKSYSNFSQNKLRNNSLDLLSIKSVFVSIIPAIVSQEFGEEFVFDFGAEREKDNNCKCFSLDNRFVWRRIKNVRVDELHQKQTIKLDLFLQQFDAWKFHTQIMFAIDEFSR